MKLYDMIYAIVMAFRPDRRPWTALAALTLMLGALVTVVLSLALAGGNVGALARSLV